MTGYQETYQDVAGSLVNIKVTARISVAGRHRPLSEKAEDSLQQGSAEAEFS